MIIMASASGTLVPAIARLVAADEDTVREVIRLFNARGWPLDAANGPASAANAGSAGDAPRSKPRDLAKRAWSAC
jgi:hypothetical protein